MITNSTWQMKLQLQQMHHHPNLSKQTKEHTRDILLPPYTTSRSDTLQQILWGDLSWTQQIENVSAQGNKTLGFLRRNSRDCAAKVMSTTYITMVHSTVEYASTVRDP